MKIRNVKTGKFLRGYQGNKPLWTSNEEEAASYEEKDIVRLHRRLKAQSQTAEVVDEVSKKTD